MMPKNINLMISVRFKKKNITLCSDQSLIQYLKFKYCSLVKKKKVNELLIIVENKVFGKSRETRPVIVS